MNDEFLGLVWFGGDLYKVVVFMRKKWYSSTAAEIKKGMI